MADCATCGAPLDDQSSVCPSCGASRSQQTAEFGPVGTDDVAAVASASTVEGPVLVVRKGPQPGERFYLDRSVVTVGRDPDRDIFLNDMTVSRSHASLETSGGTVTVRDAGSLNGTYVNGVCCDSAVLKDGDIVQVGTFQMVFFGGKEAQR
jgi:pSer/pThr/pTyr-binding forkhead associated (FHA) protein